MSRSALMSAATSAGGPANRRCSPSPACGGAVSPNTVQRKRQADRLGIAPRLSGHLAQARHLGLETRQAIERILRVGTDRIPGIADAGGSSQRRTALASDPDRRMRLLHGLRLETDIGESDMLAVELRRILGPEFNEGAHIFVGHCSTRIEVRRVDGLELLAHPARTDTQRQPATRENVDGRENLGGQHGRSMRHHHDGGHETQARRFRGDPGDLRQLFVPLAAGAAGELPGGAVGIFGRDRGRNHDVVAERRVVEAHRLAANHDLRQGYPRPTGVRRSVR